MLYSTSQPYVYKQHCSHNTGLRELHRFHNLLLQNNKALRYWYEFLPDQRKFLIFFVPLRTQSYRTVRRNQRYSLKLYLYRGFHNDKTRGTGTNYSRERRNVDWDRALQVSFLTNKISQDCNAIIEIYVCMYVCTYLYIGVLSSWEREFVRVCIHVIMVYHFTFKESLEEKPIFLHWLPKKISINKIPRVEIACDYTMQLSMLLHEPCNKVDTLVLSRVSQRGLAISILWRLFYREQFPTAEITATQLRC